MPTSTFPVPPGLAGHPLDGVVRSLFAASWGRARSWISTGKIAVDGEVRTDPLSRVRAGAQVSLTPNAKRPRPAMDLPEGALVHVDSHLIVVNKPPGISTIPYEGPHGLETEPGTLDERVRAILAKRSRGGARPALGVVHRLDKETSGLMVFTRTWLAKQSLTAQFRAHTVVRRYVAIVHGPLHAKKTMKSHIIADRGDGLRGSIEARRGHKGPASEGQLAITHVEPLEELAEATLVACRLETGRTHQIRIHLGELGHPLVGERVYIRGFTGTPILAPRIMLHAAELGFVHPATEAEMRWEQPMPDDMTEVLARLRSA